MNGAPVEQDMIKSAPPATIAVRGRPKMLLSFVVPCYNEDRRLRAVLEQLDHTRLKSFIRMTGATIRRPTFYAKADTGKETSAEPERKALRTE
jgi:hypothetical protein